MEHEDTDMEVTQGAPFESFGLSEATMRAIRNKHYLSLIHISSWASSSRRSWRASR